MTTATQKKNEITQPQIFQLDPGSFFVESSDGLKLYKVNVDGDKFCSCQDYLRHSKNNPEYRCKHVEAVLNTEDSKIFKFQSLQQNVKPKLDEHFIKNIQGKDFVLYAGLLDLSHQRGLQKLEVEAIQYPTKENGYEAICRAIATSKTGEMFVDYGDANPKNCNSMIAQHVLRMASTRAKARVLRDFTNVGMTALEELGEISSDVLGNGNGNSKKTRGRKTSSTKAKTESKQPESSPPESSPPPAKKEPIPSTDQKTSESSKDVTKPRMSEAQKRAVQNLAKRRGISEEEVESMAVEKYGTDLENLISSDAANFIRFLQQSA